MVNDMDEIIHQIRALIAVADHYRSAFYMTPSSLAAGRRWEEKRGTVPEFSWTEGGHKYTACYKVTCSCAHVYASGYYTRDGKKTNLTAVKNSLSRLEAEQERVTDKPTGQKEVKNACSNSL